MRLPIFRNLSLVLASFVVTSAGAVAAQVQQHYAAHKADALQSKLAARITTVDATLAAARKSGRLSATHAAQMKKKIDWVRTDSARNVKSQGFLSAGESASYNRTLAEIEAKLR